LTRAYTLSQFLGWSEREIEVRAAADRLAAIASVLADHRSSFDEK
jgi:hypothetical protein